MKVKTRKNRNYTSIILQEISLQAFYESKKKYDEIEGEKVIKASKKAWKEFFKLHTLEYSDTQDNDEINFLGTNFTIVKARDTKNGLPKIEYYKRNFLSEDLEREKETFWVLYDNVALSLLEQAYYNATGILMGY